MPITLTINGIDGFLSPKWSIHANATVIDNETLELNATASRQTCYITIPVNANHQYTFDLEHNGEISINTGTWSQIVAYTTNKTVAFNSGNTKEIIVALSNSTTGKFTFKRPMLVLGTAPAPYEPKRGDRMVPPVAKKNLFDGELVVGGLNTLNGSWTNATDKYRAKKYTDVKPNTTYTISGDVYYLYYYRKDNSFISAVDTKGKLTFVTPMDCYQVSFITPDNSISTPMSEIKIQLEKGTIATPHEPYAVQLNPKPKTLIPKKNLIPSFRDSRWNKHANLTVVGDYEAVLNATATNQETWLYVNVEKKNYTFTYQGDGIFRVYKGKKTTHDAYSVIVSNSGDTFTVDDSYSGVVSIRLTNGVTGQFTFKEPMLVEGSTQQAFEPYEEVLPRAKTGLRMGGTQYVQLPSMTMDSIEIDCLIDNAGYLIDARTGFSTGYFSASLKGGWTQVFSNGVEIQKLNDAPNNERVKIKLNAPSFTDDVALFTNIYKESTAFTKGTIYNVKCYLNGQVVADYDFTNPSNLVGDKLIPNAKNLIPSFEDEAWSLHSNFKVFGPNVGRLDASGTNQRSGVAINVRPLQKYFFIQNENPNTDSYYFFRDTNDVGTVVSGNTAYSNNITITAPESGVLWVSTQNSVVGSFDFIKPQLYELSGKEAQLFGSPTPQLKAPKRLLYAKR